MRPEHFNFEAAARLRDRIIAVRRTIEAQKVVWRSRIDMDLIAVARAQGQACMQVFMVRDGKLLGQEHFILDGTGERGRRRDRLGVPQAVLYRAQRKFGMNAAFDAERTGSPLALRAARDQQSPVAEKARTPAPARLRSGGSERDPRRGRARRRQRDRIRG